MSAAYRRRVAWGDVDAAGMWQFTAVLSYVEEAEIEFLRQAEVLDRLYGHLPRCYVEAQFRRPASFDDLIEVRIRLARLGTSSLHYAFVVRRGDELAAEGRLGAVLVAADGRAQPLPGDIRRHLEPYVEAVERRSGEQATCGWETTQGGAP